MTVRAAARSVVLASCALTLAAGTAGAGDAGVPTLGACGFAAGLYRLPGTDGCLRLSGFVATDLGLHAMPSGLDAMPDAMSLSAVAPRRVGASGIGRSTIGADARLSTDVRLPTDLGPARLFVSVRARH